MGDGQLWPFVHVGNSEAHRYRYTETNTPTQASPCAERTHSLLHTQTPDYKDTHTQTLLPDKHPQA